MKWLFTFKVLLLFAGPFFAQAQQVLVQNPAFDRTIRQYLEFSVPTISCQELNEIKKDVVLLDAREEKEFKVSHIAGARNIGYKKINLDVLNTIPKDSKIVVYCSIGYRSEKIGERLQQLGYFDVSNLYGSIFEWVNQDLPLVDNAGKSTNKLHTYNRSWSRWVEEGKAQKEW